jgi:hypothetical protein
MNSKTQQDSGFRVNKSNPWRQMRTEWTWETWMGKRGYLHRTSNPGPLDTDSIKNSSSAPLRSWDWKSWVLAWRCSRLCGVAQKCRVGRKGEWPLLLGEREEAGKTNTAHTCTHEERDGERVKGKQRGRGGRRRRRGCSVWS